MPDHEFEKRIQDDMAEFSLPPSLPVWERLEKQLDKKERRRPGLFWIPLMAASVLVCGYLLFQWSANKDSNHMHPKSQEAIVQPAGDSNIPTEGGKDLGAIQKKTINNTTDSSLQPGSKGIHASPLASPAVKNRHARVTSKDSLLLVGQDVVEEKPSLSTRNLYKRSVPADTRQLSRTDKHPVAQKTGEQSIIDPGTLTTEEKLETSPAKDLRASIIQNDFSTRLPIDVYSTAAAAGINASNSFTIPHVSRWQIGFTLEVGRSNLNAGKFKSLLVSSPVFADYSLSNGASTGGVISTSSSLKAGLGIAAGAFLKRQVTQKSSILIGLQYQLFTTTNNVGRKMDTLPQNSTASRINASGIYNHGNDKQFINRYHFLELPFSLESKLIAGRYPVNAEVGVSISRLISANALHYDKFAAVYYKQNNLLRNTHFNSFIGFNTILFPRSTMPVKAGPQLGYSFTKLLQQNQPGNNHFLFVGLKTSVLIKKIK